MQPPTRSSARTVLLAAAATMILAVVMVVEGSGMPPADERSGFATALVAVELARSPAEAFRALGPVTDGARQALARVVVIDFAFALAYPLLSLAIAFFLTRSRALRALAALLAVAMAVADVLENLALLELLAPRVLDSPGVGGTAALVDTVRTWSIVKWAALFAAALQTSLLLFARGGGARIAAVLPLAVAAVGAVGLALPAHRPLVELGGVYGMLATWTVIVLMALARAGLKTRRR
jgi:hypothetical protein